MAINFTFNPAQYEEKSFDLIPVGDYRVRVNEVVETTFRSGKQGYKITLDVSGKNSKLWAYLVIDPSNPKQTNDTLGSFFGAFGIANYDLNANATWVGKVGGCHVKHDVYEGNTNAKIAYWLNQKKQEKLPAWVEPSNSTGTTNPTGFVAVDTTMDAPADLPF